MGRLHRDVRDSESGGTISTVSSPKTVVDGCDGDHGEQAKKAIERRIHL